jgi:PKD repeat protein
MKKITLFLVLLINISLMFAGHVDEQQAKSIALSFFNMKNETGANKTLNDVNLVYQEKYGLNSIDTITSFYVYNVSTHGFVIVSGDNCVQPILGYSTNNRFRQNDIPSNVEYLLDNYSDQVVYAVINNHQPSEKVIECWYNLENNIQITNGKDTHVNPLVQSIWKQGSPYNNYCPQDAGSPYSNGRVPVGCVATAIAQILNYWEYPIHGTGSHYYFADNSDNGYGDYGYQYADFANTTYQYSSMPNELTDESPQVSIDAVATLCYHSGVAVEMMYGPTGSGAYSLEYSPGLHSAEYALKTYYSYLNAQGIARDNYTDLQWVNILKNELNNERPVYYSGSGDSGGHAFICDGYDESDFFHFNLGWGGYYNGYYEINDIAPNEETDFNNNNQAIIGVYREMPEISDISTDIGIQGETLSVTVTGNNTHFGQGTGTTLVWFTQASETTISSNSVIVNSSDELVAEITFNHTHPIGFYDVNVSNDLDGVLTKQNSFYLSKGVVEDFEDSNQLPMNWATSEENPYTIVDAADEDNLTNHTTGADGNVAFFDCWTYAAAEEGQIWTPKLAVTAGDATFSFWINYYLISGDYGNTAELYVAVSNDNGATWTESATNLIDGQHGAGWFQHTIDLTAFESMDYTDENVIVRLRAISDYGSYNISVDDFVMPNIYIPSTPDLSIEGFLDITYTMLPLNQMTAITPGASVVNVGAELSDATDVDFAVTGETYTESVPLTVPMANGAVEEVTATTGFTPAATGTFEFTMGATVANDDNADDNTDAVSFTVTDDEMAYDNEDIVGQLGAGSGAMMGNKFVFNADDGLIGAKFYITDNITEGYDCTVKVYDFTGGTVGSVLAESETVSVAGATNAWYDVDFNLAVTAGQEVLIVVDNIDAAAFMALARDANYVEDVSYASTDSAAFDEVGGIGFPNVFLVRAITGEPPACAAPIQLTATNITSTSADLGWTSDGYTWNIEWGEAGFSQSEGITVTGVTANPYLLASFDDGIAYDFYVQTDCGVDGSSEWTGPFTFTTEPLCDGVTVLLESFENSFPPDCWTKANLFGGTGWEQQTNGTSPMPGMVGGTIDVPEGGGNAVAYCTWNTGGTSSNDQWLITPQISISTNYELSFWIRKYGGYAEALDVLVSTTDNTILSFTNQLTGINWTSEEGDEWVKYSYDLSSFSGEQIYIAFREHVDDNITDGAALLLDMVRIGPPVFFIADNTEGCGSLTVNFTDASAGNITSWLWNFGDGNTSTLQNPIHTYNLPGIYTVSLTATDENGSDTFIATDLIHVYDNPVVDLGDEIEQCGGDVVLDAGSGFDLYVWNGVLEDQTYSVSTSDTYTVVVEDANGCTGTDEIVVTIHDIPSIYLGDDIEQCGGSATLNAGGGFSSYTWNGTSGNQTYTVSESGTYAVVVEDANGCTATDEIQVDIYDIPEVDLGTDIEQCGGSVTLDAGNGFTGYLWNGNPGNSTLTISNSGTYTVEVEDANGCTASDAIDVSIYNVPTVDLGDDVEQCGGSVTLDAGTGFDTYTWNGTAGNQTHTVSASDTYNVVVEDANGCTATDAVDVTIFEAPEVDLGDDVEQCGGSVTLDAGTGFDTYTWNGTTGNQTHTVSASDTYAVVVEDANGCTATDAVDVTIYESPEVDLGDDISICSGSSATLDAGSGFYIYLWNGTGGTSTHVVSAPGTYEVQVFDSNGCTASDDVEVTVLPSPTISLSITEESSQGASDGTVTANPETGTLPFDYSWDTGAETATATGLTAGEYCVTVSDGNGCSTSDCISVTVADQPNPPVAEFTADATQGCNMLTVQFTDMSTNNPTGWNWQFGDGTSSTEEDPQHTYTGSGVYTVTLTVSNDDGTSDPEIKTDYIAVGETPQLSMSMTQESSDGASDGTATVEATGGLGDVTYLWENSETGAEITGLTAGTYCVTVTDEAGCSAADCIDVSVVENNYAAFTSDVTEGCAPLEVQFTDQSTGNVLSWTWNFGDGTTSTEQNPLHNYTDAGSYSISLSVIYADGSDTHTEVDYIIVNETPELSFEVTDESEAGASDGAISMTISGGESPYIINWSNNAHTETIINLSAGVYSVVVIDANGCIAVGNATVEVDTDIAGTIADEIKIYPNPASETLYIVSSTEINSINIYDISGKRIFTKDVIDKTCEIALLDIKSGIYFIEISCDSGTVMQKIVKE